MGTDQNGDPVQYGLHGWQDQALGISRVQGPWLGVVLSVNHADDKNNLWHKMLQGNVKSSAQAPYVEANVFCFMSGMKISEVVPNCIVIPKGKCSRRSSNPGSLPDWTEDIPEGCLDSEVEAFLQGGSRRGLEGLSGDWVFVDFIGGVRQMAYISDWFPNPFNLKDAAKRGDGRRYIVRRNGTEIKIDRNGDYTLTHKSGHYFQMRGEELTIKSPAGQLILLDEEGGLTVQDGEGRSVSIDKNGIVVNNGESVIALEGAIASVEADSEINFAAPNIELLASEINLSGGNPAPLMLKSYNAELIKQITDYIAKTPPSAITAVLVVLLGLFTAVETSNNHGTSVLFGE